MELMEFIWLSTPGTPHHGSTGLFIPPSLSLLSSLFFFFFFAVLCQSPRL